MGRKFVYRPKDPNASPNGFVEITAETRETRALDAPINTGRFYENTSSPIDGADIGSRKRHENYMRERNLTLASDFSGVWNKAKAQRDGVAQGRLADKTRRDDVGRALHKLYPE
jgi:hypothetical protein